MLGKLQLRAGGWGNVSAQELYGMSVLCVGANPAGFLGEQRLRRAGRGLYRRGATRVLAPKGFAQWQLLQEYGILPVDTSHFLRTQALPLTLAALEQQGCSSARATVVLHGERAGEDMAQVALQLSKQVRQLVINAPKGGEQLAKWLRWELGLPILPAHEQGEVALTLQPTATPVQAQAQVQLYGIEPQLAGLRLCVPTLAQEDADDLALISSLWERGRLAREMVKIT